MKNRSDFWAGRPVLVTGCTGILGSWLVAALADSGASVVGLGRGVKDHQGRITFVRGDVVDFELLKRILKKHEIDTIIHGAAQTIVSTAKEDPLSTFQTNIRGTWNVLEGARSFSGVNRVLVASSDKAYGAHDKLPYVEDAPLLGSSPYEMSKACADMIARAYAASYDMPVAVTRCGNFFGGRDLNWSRIVPGTVRCLIRDEPVVVRSDGTPRRTYLYIKDAVNAYMTLAERFDDLSLGGEVFNFGMDEPVSVLEMVNAVIAVSGRRDIEPVVLAESTGEIQDQYLDSSKARRVLKWEPQYTLGEGLAETMEWYRRYFEKA